MSDGPIRVVFVVPLLRTGGAERHLSTLLPRMDPTRFVPSVVCIGEAGELFPDLVAAGVDAQALNLGKWQAGRALRELVSIFRDAKPDVVVVAGRNAEVLGRIAARVTGVPKTVMWVHNASEITPRGVVHRLVDRALIPWTDAYFGVAEVQRSFLTDERGYPADKIRIIHNGVDPSTFDGADGPAPRAEFGFADDDPVVGIVGSLRPVKDHDTFLRAARLVVDDLPRAKFLVVGFGERRAALEQLCDDLGIAANVHFTGGRDDVDRILRTMDVFAMTSLTECLPMALLEAMACGLPTVCTAVGGVVEVVDDGVTGYLVTPQDPSELAARLSSLLSDPQAAQRMGRAARRRIDTTFSLDRSVAAAESAIEDLIAPAYAPSGRAW